jgi:hypothetical protein
VSDYLGMWKAEVFGFASFIETDSDLRLKQYLPCVLIHT